MKFDSEIMIGNSIVSNDSRTFIVAEAGVNHNGQLDVAKEMVEVAADAGVDAVKFQIFNTDSLILKDISKASYQIKTTGSKASQYEMLKSLEASTDFFLKIKELCRERGIQFLCTPFEQDSLETLMEIGVPAIKIAATDITNIQYLRKVASCNLPIILSAGMCYLDEIRIALESIYPINKRVVLLHTTANYPINDEEANLNVLDTLKKEFDVILGYSDHSIGVGAAPFAVSKGAKVIEKHFTLDRKMSGPDHQASVEPDELIQLVKDVRRVETYLGSSVKMPTISEQGTRKSLQKCFVASKTIKKGDFFSDDNIVAKRTNGEGVSAVYYDQLIGRESMCDYLPNEIIKW